MPNAEKLEKVAALAERIKGSNALLLAEYRGLTMHDATDLRRSLADQARLAVVKNTLMQRAAGQAGIAELDALLAGPTAVAFVQGDVVAAAKRVVDASKRFPALVLKGAYLDGRVLGPAEAQALATLESREVMLSKIAGMMKSEMSRAASMFQALQGRFLGLLEAYKDKLPAPDSTADEPPEAAAAPSEDEPANEPAGEPGNEPENETDKENEPANESDNGPENEPENGEE